MEGGQIIAIYKEILNYKIIKSYYSIFISCILIMSLIYVYNVWLLTGYQKKLLYPEAVVNHSCS